MKIIETDLDGFGADVVGKCIASRSQRTPVYAGLKHYYLFGAQEGESAPYGKIYPHIDLLSSYLYSQGAVEFDIAVADQPQSVSEQSELLGNRLNSMFRKRGVAQMFSQALSWSLVFNSTFLKFNWNRGKLVPYMVEPHNFGVLREDVIDLDRQEAFVHCYTISQSELQRRTSGLTNGADIMRRVVATPVQQEDVFPESVNRMIIAGTVNFTTTTTQGLVNVPELMGQLQYKPRVQEDLVEMYELWCWDDEKEDWRTITIAAPGVVIYGRASVGNVLGVKGRHPFVKVCPNELYDYFFGWSEITGLLKLQDWATERLREIRRILQKQANPPKALSGWAGITDEKIAALDMPSSWISDPSNGAKVELLAPDLPNDLWQEIIMIQEMFNDVSGISDILQGHGESGVRAKSHADILARLGSSRIKKRALDIESTLARIGDLTLAIMRAKDDHKYTMKDGTKFTAAQFPEENEVKVDGHSASPVFVNDSMALAFQLAKAGAIGPDSLLELTKPAKLDLLQVRLEKMQAEKKKMEQAALMAEAAGGKKTGLSAVG